VVRLTLLSRAYCHLCDEMAAALAPLAAAHGAVVTTLDVDADPALADAWGELVPVLLLGSADDGVELCHYHLDAARVGAVLSGIDDPAAGA
jgi:thiol-disulfide isomerase/thioredoxin